MVANESNLKEGCEILMQASEPDIYRVNAFRISGLTVNASTREITNQLSKNQLLEKYGNKSEIIDSPFPILPNPDAAQRREALHRLRDPETRIIDELFWFWPNSIETVNMDNALAALARNDIKSAENIWIDYEANLTESNVSRHNLAILSHLLVLDLELNGNHLDEGTIKKRNKYWKDTYKRWKLLFDHEGFWSRLSARVRQMDDPRLTTGFVKRLRESLPNAILQINALLAQRAAEAGNPDEARRHLRILYDSGFGTESCLVTLKRVVDPLRIRIKTICKSFSDEAYPEVKSKLTASIKLIEQTKNLLSILDILLPDDSPIREGAHDEVALEAIGLLISYANTTEDWDSVVPIFEDLRKIVVGESARLRVEKNYDIFKSNIEYDLLYKTCFYCKKNRLSANSVVKIKMYGNVRLEWEYSPYRRQVRTWNYNTVEVPRCSDCQKKHAKAVNYPLMGAGMGLLLGIGGGSIAGPDYAFLLVVCLIVLGIVVGNIIKSRKMDTKKYSYYKEFPRIKEYLKQGWTWGEKPAS